MKYRDHDSVMTLTKANLPMMELMAEQFPGGFFIYQEGETQELLYANENVFHLYGCKDLDEFKELTGFTFRGMVYPEDYDRIQNSINEQVETDDKAQDHVTYRIRRKDGEIRWLDDYGHFSHSPDFGDIYFVFVNDITANYHMQEENLRRAEVIDGLSHDYTSIFLLDLDTDEMMPYRLKGNHFSRIYEKRKQEGRLREYWPEITQIYLEQYVCPEDRELYSSEAAETRIRQRLEESSTYTIEYRLQEKDGKLLHMQMQVVRIDGVWHGHHAVIGYRDMTDQVEKIRQKTREEEREREKRVNEAKNTFLFHVSHDLRTPMNTIIGYMALARKHLQDPATVDEYLGNSEMASRQLLSLIDDILDVTQLNSGEVQTKRVEGNIRQEVTRTVESLRLQMEEKKLDLQLDVSDEQACADFSHIQRILLNLLDNSIKYTPEGGRIEVRGYHEAVGEDGETTYILSIRDSGIGMSPEFVSKAFELFERERNSTESGIEGTGMGLPVVKRLADVLGGKVEIHSKRNQGTEVILELPVQILEASSETTEVSPEDVGALQKKYRVLLAEDIEINRMLAKVVLEEAGFSVDDVEDGARALEAVSKNPAGTYGCILMDIQMPNMDGYEATRRIRQLGREDTVRLPIIALSANARKEDREAAKAAGMNRHIPKPFDTPELIRIVSQALVFMG